jgi:plastocyanin
MAVLLVLATAVAVAAFTVAGCGNDDDEAAEETTAETEEAAGQPVHVDVVETDFEIDPKDATVDEGGTIDFDIRNDGETTHQLTIEPQEGGIPRTSDRIPPGHGDTFPVVSLDPGKYIWYCPIGNHRQMGMEGTLTVGGG